MPGAFVTGAFVAGAFVMPWLIISDIISSKAYIFYDY